MDDSGYIEEQPKSLQSVTRSRIVEWLVPNLMLVGVHNTSKNLRKYLQRLPVHSRSLLLEEGLDMYGQMYAIGLCTQSIHSGIVHLVDSLISVGIKDFEYRYTNFLPLKHLRNLLQVLSVNSEDLQTLKLLETKINNEESNDVDEHNCFGEQSNIASIFKRVLLRSHNITHIALHSICTDNILAAIGDTCSNLQTLDMINSKEVTDKGLCYLSHVVECGAHYTQEDLVNVKCLYFLPDNIKKTVKPCRDAKSPKHKCSFIRHRTRVCSTLRNISLQGTNISVIGLRVLFSLMNKLIKVGTEKLEECLDSIYEDYQKATQNGDKVKFSSLNLTSLSVSNLTPSRLKALTHLCSSVEDMTFESISCSLLELVNFNSISKLRLTFDDEYDARYLVLGFMNYLTVSGHMLKELDIIGYDIINGIALSWILKACSNLQKLSLKARGHFSWIDSVEDILNFGCHKLKNIKLKELTILMPIQADDARALLLNATQLHTVRFHSILGQHDFLLSLCRARASISKALTSFFVDKGNVLASPKFVAQFWQKNPQIRHIGFVKYSKEKLDLKDCSRLCLVSEL